MDKPLRVHLCPQVPSRLRFCRSCILPHSTIRGAQRNHLSFQSMPCRARSSFGRAARESHTPKPAAQQLTKSSDITWATTFPHLTEGQGTNWATIWYPIYMITLAYLWFNSPRQPGEI